MAWTSPRTWVVNEVFTASIGNVHIRDNLNYLYGGTGSTVKGSFAARQNAVTTCTNNTETTIICQVEDRDNESAYNNATGIWTCAVTGFYAFSGSISWASNGTGVRFVALVQSNGLLARSYVTAATDAIGHDHVAQTWLVTAGATVKMSGFQTSGGNLDTSGNNDTVFSGIWLGN